ncbi:MAG TPA: hypothetical protein PLU83_01810 [Phycicoccus sp.]|jgi:hypothetical protein|nr:hypothetical protein [Phycicoccus sp.]HQK30304.1 hypothetical protein [Phycicoccus sp.]HQY95696.1 hypothetical protein [Phycicoccus sp.]HRA45108.1 hypothetical protein [Phycicoccus sp.]
MTTSSFRAGPRSGHGLVLVRGHARASARWLKRGLVPVAAVELPGWTGICLTEATARTAPPYDVGLEVLAARPTPTRRRPSIGLFVIDGCAIVTVQQRGWRADQRWLVWQPGHGVRRTPDLAPLPASLITATAGSTVTAKEVADHFSVTTGQPVDRLCGLLSLLGLPGESLLRGGAPSDAETVEPTRGSVRRFDHLVHGDEGPQPVVPS